MWLYEMMHVLKVIGGLSFPFALLSLFACQPQVTELPFETIEKVGLQTSARIYESRQPGLMVLARPEEIAGVDDLVSTEAKAQLRALDYNIYFVLIVFQGGKPDDGYGVDVKRIAREGNRVMVFAEFLSPKPGLERHPIVTSPYHLVKVKRVGSWAERIAVEVTVEGTTVASTSHHIP